MANQSTPQAMQNGGYTMEECTDACIECHRVCLETVIYSLQRGGEEAEASHIRLLLDCAEICQTSANFMIRGSDLHVRTCGVCADVCDQCAASCERLGYDEQLRFCAETCRRCSESCREMASSGYTESENDTRAV